MASLPHGVPRGLPHAPGPLPRTWSLQGVPVKGLEQRRSQRPSPSFLGTWACPGHFRDLQVVPCREIPASATTVGGIEPSLHTRHSPKHFPCVLRARLFCFPHQPRLLGIIISTLRMRKRGHAQLTELAPVHVARNWQERSNLCTQLQSSLLNH